MPKRASQVVLTALEHQALEQVIRRQRSEQQVVLRARIVLAAAQGMTNAQIARTLTIHVDTVRLWRDRWVGLQGMDGETLSIVERLQDAPALEPSRSLLPNNAVRWPPWRVKPQPKWDAPSASGPGGRSPTN